MFYKIFCKTYIVVMDQNKMLECVIKWSSDRGYIFMYCVCKKSCPYSYIEALYKNGQDLLDTPIA